MPVEPAAAGLTVQRRFAGVSFRLHLPANDPYAELLHTNFAALDEATADPDLTIRVRSEADAYWLDSANQTLGPVSTTDLIYEIEGILVPGSQLVRPDLVFMHAAALHYQGRTCLLVGQSGAGKSTLCWALSQSGFAYLSDELAPLEQHDRAFQVHPYAHALCLKRQPPPPFQLPPTAFDTGRTWHVPAEHLQLHQGVTPISHLFVVSHALEGSPELRPLSVAATALELYPQLLNALAHPNKGLDAVASVARSVASFAIVSTDLAATCDLIVQAMHDEHKHPDRA